MVRRRGPQPGTHHQRVCVLERHLRRADAEQLRQGGGKQQADLLRTPGEEGKAGRLSPRAARLGAAGGAAGTHPVLVAQQLALRQGGVQGGRHAGALL